MCYQPPVLRVRKVALANLLDLIDIRHHCRLRLTQISRLITNMNKPGKNLL